MFRIFEIMAVEHVAGITVNNDENIHVICSQRVPKQS